MATPTCGVLWFVGELAGSVVLAHRPDDEAGAQLDPVEDPNYWDRVLRLSPAAAAGIGASLVAHAVELDADGATAAVATVLRDARLF